MNPNGPSNPSHNSNENQNRTKRLSKLSDHPDTPLGISRFEHGSYQSFDTAVRDLIQQQPDTPIGDYMVAPVHDTTQNTLKRRSNTFECFKPTSYTEKVIFRLGSVDSSRSLPMITAAESLRSHLRSNDCDSPKSGDLIIGSDILAMSDDSQGHGFTTSAIIQPYCVASLDGGHATACCELVEQEGSVGSVGSDEFCPGPGKSVVTKGLLTLKVVLNEFT